MRQFLAWDEAVLVRVRRWEKPALTPLMRFFTRCGDASSWVLLGLVLLSVGGTSSVLGGRLATAAVLATVLVQPLKRLWRRPRPNRRILGFTALVENPDAFSFPSGHAAAAVAVALALAGHGQFLPALLALLALGVGFSRVYLGAHYPLDVAAGSLLGVMAGAATRVLFALPG
jgi:undecaprenyl-diphosphatase